jgi:mono/diheme cytochrome c family protein
MTEDRGPRTEAGSRRPEAGQRVVLICMGLLALPLIAACSGDSAANAEPVRHYALGRAASGDEIAKWDIAVGPDGATLPPGSGTVDSGAVLFKAICANCHGANGEGMAPAYPALIGRDPKGENFVFDTDFKITRTIGNYWPYATTVFDYVRRAMPLTAPGSLSNDDVYSLTAYLLAANQVIPMNSTLDAAALRRVKMPYVDHFVRDDRRGGHEVR